MRHLLDLADAAFLCCARHSPDALVRGKDRWNEKKLLRAQPEFQRSAAVGNPNQWLELVPLAAIRRKVALSGKTGKCPAYVMAKQLSTQSSRV